jgi:hypothetical protein
VQPSSKIEWSVYVFIARKLKKVADIKPDSGENIELITVDFDQFIEIAKRDNFYEQEIIGEVLEASLNPVKKQQLRKLFLRK